MPKYKVRLESQTDSQAREVTLTRDTAEQARADCEAKEAELVAFQLPADELKRIEKNTEIRDDGKVIGGPARDRGNLHAHYQEKPYKVVSVEEV